MGTELCEYNVDGTIFELDLPSNTLTVGESVDIDIRVTTKNTEQKFSAITMTLKTRYASGSEYEEIALNDVTLADTLSIDSGVTGTHETPVTIPYRTPSTIGSVDVWAEIGFDVGQTTYEYEEHLEIVPTNRFMAIFDAMIDLGFALRDVECQADRTASDQPFVQKFRFSPASGPFRGELDRVELFARTEPERVVLFVAADCEDDPRREIPRTERSKLTIYDTEESQVIDQLRSRIDDISY